MNNFVKMDVAIEILADKISNTTKKFYKTNNETYKNEITNLFEERTKIYNGDLEIINKVINVYGNELKRELIGKNTIDSL